MKTFDSMTKEEREAVRLDPRAKWRRKRCKSCMRFGRGCFGDAYCKKHTKPWDKACYEYK